MARPGLLQHRKFRRLARVLHSQALAMGSLELLWSSCYENGDEYLGDSQDVETAACWDGEPGILTQALLTAGGDGEFGFIEEVPDRPGKFQVHDLWHHVPDYVQKRRRREAARRDKSDPCPDPGRRTPDSDRTVTDQCPDDGDRSEEHDCHTRAQSTPTPAPAPAPAPQKRLNDLSAPKPAKPPRVPSWAKAHPPEILDTISEILDTWPHHKSDTQPEFDPKKPRQPVPVSSAPDLALRLAEIVKKGGDLDVCRAIAARAVREFRSEGKWIKAAQHFFGKLGPWEAYYQAEVTNRAMDPPENDSPPPGARMRQGDGLQRLAEVPA